MKHYGLLIAMFFQVAFSQLSFPAAPAPFRWSAMFSRDTCGVHDTLSLRLRLAIDKGYYVYKSKTSVRPACPGLRFGAPAFSAAAVHYDSLTGKKERVFVDSMIAVIPCTIEEYVSDTVASAVVCSYQGCMSAMCFLPAKDSLSCTLCVRPDTVQQHTGKSAASETDVSSRIPAEGSGGGAGGGFIALLLAFIGGLLTCLTPCVYPLIPVTISVFGATAAKRTRAFGLSCLYVAGIAVMFSTLGFVLASTGRVFGQFMANPWVIGFIAVVFCLFGISLLGAFDVQLPSSLQNKISAFTGRSSGPRKVFFMGLVAGIIAAPCTGPSLGAILTYVATTGNQWMGMAMLFSFSMGLGLPFLALGTFSSLVASRPKPGPWMESVKSVLGIVMFIMALYFLRGVLPALDRLFFSTPLFFGSMSALVAGGLAMGAVHLSYHGGSWYIAIRKTTGCILVTIGAFGIAGAALFGAPAHAGKERQNAEKSGMAWISDIEYGLKQGRAMNMPVIIDFYADWCSACRELDKKTFSDPRVQKEVSRFIRVKADFTKETLETKQLARAYSLRGLPVIEFYSSDGKRRSDMRLTGFVNAAALLEHLKPLR